MRCSLTGIITSSLGGLYTVRTFGQTVPDTLSCRARGVFRHCDKKPLVGDTVTVEYDDASPDDSLVLSDILKRRTEFIRPPMANLTHLFCVFAAARPAPSTETVDKLLAVCVHQGVKASVVVTKGDLGEKEMRRYADIYRLAGFDVFTVQTDTLDGYAPLTEYIKNLPPQSIAAFAGASGVGKSTLLNILFPSLLLATGEISRRIERGKHTTRAVTLFPINAVEGTECSYIADTPGFSLLDFAHFDFFSLPDLFDAYPDFAPYHGKCRFADCTHTGEGDDECAVAKAVKQGFISESRHESYRALYKILKEKESDYKRKKQSNN